ncbi:MAG: NAD(P)H-hydrate dehydratase [Actinomycetota bacterium]|jgi:NAD(P)H-hydrate epimerase|nr:NAD(P)H-hydrate dehydratase [Rubrobacter sp.]MDQ3508104.1 NAD(P)H-hydrate dehydratase [Actinomycetota bacterium]
MKLYTAAEMSRADEAAQNLGIPGGVLMERAGSEMAKTALETFASTRALVVVCGGGNNGGDGFVIARELHRFGASVSVLATKDEYKGDAKTNHDVLKNLGVEFIRPEDLETELEKADLAVDALLGTGFSGEVREKEANLIRRMNGSETPVVAVDMPSGVDGSTGEVAGEAVRADLTVCAHAAKVGCVVSPGREYAGEVSVIEIGIPKEAEPEASVVWTDADSLRGSIPRTGDDSHKYSAGAVLVAASSRSMTGAAAMVVGGAERAGCGIVFLATPESAAPALDSHLTEALVYGVPENDEGHMHGGSLEGILELTGRATSLIVGPGMGVGDGQKELLESILRDVIEAPILLDADALTNLADSDAIAKRTAPTVITPHAGELGRLLGSGAREVSARRLFSARNAAEKFGCTVLLKGSDTLIVEGSRAAVNSTGHVALATAGTGDVLSGVIGALLSHGMEPFEAARAGAWVHGRAAEMWIESTGWPAESLVATDLFDFIPEAVGEVV